MLWWLLIILTLLVGLSLWLRVEYYRQNTSAPEARASPLSMAIQELVATSGGIYLAVITLTAFLKLDVPEKITLLRANVDPLALSAIGAAILQPIVLRLFHKIVSR